MKQELNADGTGKRSLVIPFLAGGLVGAGIMMLLAPKSGKEVRQDISKAASDSRERVVSAAEKGKALLEEGKSAVTDAVEAGKTAYLREKEKHQQAA